MGAFLGDEGDQVEGLVREVERSVSGDEEAGSGVGERVRMGKGAGDGSEEVGGGGEEGLVGEN